MIDSFLLLGFLLCMALISIGSMIGAGVQLHGVHREQQVRARMRRLRKGSQPWVTVLVYGDGAIDPSGTLRALLRSRYHAFDIVYIDDSQQKAWLSRLPESERLRVLQRRRKTPLRAALNAGYRKGSRGEVVMAVRAGELLAPNALKRAVAHREGRVTWRLLSPQNAEVDTLQALLQSLTRTIFSRTPGVWCGTARALGSASVRSPLPLGAYRFASAGLGVVVFATLVWSVSSVGPQALWYVWIIITTYGLMMVWLRVRGTLGTRLALSLSVPSALFLLPAHAVVRGISHFAFRK